MESVIRLEHVEKIYTGGKDEVEALRDVSLSV